MPSFSDYNKCGMLKEKNNKEQPIRTWTRVETFCNTEAYKNFTTEQLNFRRKQEILEYKKNANTVSKKQIYSYVNKFRNVKNISTFIRKGNTLICPYEYYDDWVQLGQYIYCDISNVDFATFASLNSKGDILAVGSPYSDISGQNSGLVKVYQYIDTSWQQIGQDICGNNTGDNFGYSVALNSNGDILAVSSPYSDISWQDSGLVKVYQYNQNTNNWLQQGQDICGNNTDDRFGFSITLNSEGDILAVGSPYSDISGQDSGLVKVYQYIDTSWLQLGQDIYGNQDDKIGWSVALNSNGDILAVGSPYSDISGGNSGLVKVYYYNQNTNNWLQQGQDIWGNQNANFGWSVALNSNGDILAVGTTYSDINGQDSGLVKVYQYNGTSWQQQGQDICGNKTDDNLGFSVALNSEGNILAVGSPYSDIRGQNSGLVKVYQYNQNTNKWIQLGKDICGNNAGNNFGLSIALNSDGNILASGSHSIDINNANSDFIEVYNLEKKILEKKAEKVPLVNYNTIRSYPTD